MPLTSKMKKFIDTLPKRFNHKKIREQILIFLTDNYSNKQSRITQFYKLSEAVASKYNKPKETFKPPDNWLDLRRQATIMRDEAPKTIKTVPTERYIEFGEFIQNTWETHSNEGHMLTLLLLWSSGRRLADITSDKREIKLVDGQLWYKPTKKKEREWCKFNVNFMTPEEWFNNWKRLDTLLKRGLKPGTIQQYLNRKLKELEWTNDLTPHSFRALYARWFVETTDGLNESNDIENMKRELCHSSSESTLTYRNVRFEPPVKEYLKEKEEPTPPPTPPSTPPPPPSNQPPPIPPPLQPQQPQVRNLDQLTLNW